MALTPDKLAHFETIGPAGVELEIARGLHGQAEDSPPRIDAKNWVSSAKTREASDHARKALEETSNANEIALMALAEASKANEIASMALSSANSDARRARLEARTANVIAASTLTWAILDKINAWAALKAWLR